MLVRVVFNLLQTLKPKAGVGHYAARLYDALRDQLPADALEGFPGPRLAGIVRRAQNMRSGGRAPIGSAMTAASVRTGVKDLVRAAGRGCLRWAFRRAWRRGDYHLYHEPNFIPLADDVPTVVTVHDLSVILHPEWHPADRVRDHERRFRGALAGVRHILADTHTVRDEIITHLGVAPERVTAVHLGVGPEYFAAGPDSAERVRSELGLPANYLLFVGTIEPRKNVMTLLRAYYDLPKELRRRCPLVLAGGWGWKAADVAEFVRIEGEDKGVLHLGYTDDRHLPGLYAGARALIYPSLYEGFGLPPLEMLAAGGVVISSTAAALREVLGAQARFVEPFDVAGWRDALSRTITDDDWLASLRRGGRERAGQFTWERCAVETAAVYRTAISRLCRAA
jgi:alpha-1,3-rhamnosyl/mannosyltransferase